MGLEVETSWPRLKHTGLGWKQIDLDMEVEINWPRLKQIYLGWNKFT